jgi:proteasome lid subunit RPN8/RPN11
MLEVQTKPETYRFGLELLLPSGQRVGEVHLECGDFARAVEATFFDALRRGLFTDYAPSLDRARIEPRFPSDAGPKPQVEGFEVVLPTDAGSEHRRAFGIDFFSGLVLRTGAQLALAGKVSGDATLLYRLGAYLDPIEKRTAGGLNIELESAPTAIPVRPGSRRAFGATEAWDHPTPDDFPVLIPRHVLQESVEEARRAPEREVGGVLLGHLRRDDETGEVFLEVTCMVPAEETQATSTSVTFTHATWARVREVIEWRGEGEIFAGWVHSHPFRFCAECPLPVPAECLAKVLFYSIDDRFLMELSFARPFMVGLLTAVEPRVETALGHLPVKLFGWRDGSIEGRGFEVIES